jgi:hypothetical protein
MIGYARVRGFSTGAATMRERGRLSDHVAARSDLDRLAGILSLIIAIVGGVVGIVFISISIRDIRFDNIPIFFGTSTFTKFGLGLFFAHWAWGVKTDLQIQSRHYQRDPNRGKMVRRSVAGIIIFNLFFIALFYFHKDLVVFQLILLGLIISNYYSWWAIISQANPMAASSRDALSRSTDWFALEKLELVYRYMNGRWQQIRFIVLIILCAMQLLIASAIEGWPPADGLRQGLAALFGEALLPHVPGLLFFVYVLISSAWMGSMRLRVLFGLDVIADLLERYTMRKRSAPRQTDGP